MADTVPFPPLVELPKPPYPLPKVTRVTPNKLGTRYFMSRPAPPDRIIYHSTETGNVRSSSLAWLSTHRDSEVSCHTLVHRDGSLTEIVPPMWTAVHAGYTLPGWGNGKSLGLEIENSSSEVMNRVEHYGEKQLVGASYRAATWAFSFGITDELIKAHKEVAVYGPRDPRVGQLGRKTDPTGPFPHDKFRALVWEWVAFLRSLPPELHVVFII